MMNIIDDKGKPIILDNHDPDKTIKCKCGGEIRWIDDQSMPKFLPDCVTFIGMQFRCDSCSKIYDFYSRPISEPIATVTIDANIRALAKRIARLERLAHEHKTISEIMERK